ncbi:hypothetical protein GCM10023148_56750 [Actinokineospora soli]
MGNTAAPERPTTGAKSATWWAQRGTMNCTIHNYNIVPLRNGRSIAVGGHYQAGTWAADFTRVPQEFSLP